MLLSPRVSICPMVVGAVIAWGGFCAEKDLIGTVEQPRHR
jgi:hypothetical protein